MTNRTTYQTETGGIQRIKDGFVLTIFLGKGVGRDMQILITPLGEMIGFDNSPVIDSDVALARFLLRKIDEESLCGRLYPGMPNPKLVHQAKIQLGRH